MFKAFAALSTALLFLVIGYTIIQAQEETPTVPTPMPVEQMIIPGFKVGQVLLNETFDKDDAWENYEDFNNDISLAVMDGLYRMHDGNINGGFIWGLNDQSHKDVVIQAQATLVSPDLVDSYGLM